MNRTIRAWRGIVPLASLLLLTLTMRDGEMMGYRFITAMSYVQMEWFDHGATSLGRTSIIFRSVEGAPEWNHASNCIVAPAGAVVGRLILATPPESGDNGSFWFDDLGLYPFSETTDVGEGRVGAPGLDLSMSGERRSTFP